MDDNLLRQAALDHYNRHYRNATYRAFQQTVQAALHASGVNTPDVLTFWLNALTDAALDVSGHPSYRGACRRLVIHMTDDALLDAICAEAAFDHLARFEREGNTLLADSRLWYRALHDLPALQDAVEQCAALARDGHEATLRTTTHLLTAAALLLRTTRLLLSDADPAYTAEKATHAVHALSAALHAAATVSEAHAHAFAPLLQNVRT